MLAIGKRAVDPDNMVILVVGKKAEIIDQLNALGLLVVHLDWGKFELI